MLSNPFKSLKIKTVTLLYMDRTSFNLKMVLLQLASIGIPYFVYVGTCAVFKSKCHFSVDMGSFLCVCISKYGRHSSVSFWRVI